MRYSPIIRFRIDRKIADRAHRMAQARGLELPDVMRMMVTEAVRTGSFGIDDEDDDHLSEACSALKPFEPRYWEPFKAAIDAELAIALLQHAIAIPDNQPAESQHAQKADLASRERWRQEHDEALQQLAELDVSNRQTIDGVLQRWGGKVWLNQRPATESARVIEQRLAADVMAGTERSTKPAAILVLGQPGAGVSFAAALLAREMARTAGPAVGLSAQRLCAYDPEQDEARATRRLRRAIDSARQQRRNIVIEEEVVDPQWTSRCLERLGKDGYAVQAVFVCVGSAVSRLAITARYALWRQHHLPTRFVPATRHDLELANLRATLAFVEGKGHVDGLRVITREGRQLFENRMAGEDWLRPPRGAAIFDKEQAGAMPEKEVVQMTMRWETLTRVLVHDRAVPQDVKGQILNWRTDAVERCERSKLGAQILQWAYEGAAFREMDRFTFEEAFPHNARASALMGDAIIEAEQYDAAESARFLRSARENIAQRIERGDIARIAARNEAMKLRN
jgi:antitoxin component of RelBE/YafQ-DinJ toxin-antitoxin module